jgi:hypothetical protein
MRILHLDSGREMRGGQWQALRLHQGLLKAGHESFLLAHRDSPLLRVLQREGLPFEELAGWRVAHLSRRVDLVHAHDARSHTIAALLSATPLVVSRRVAFPVRKSALSRWKYRRPVLFLAVSKYVEQQLEAAGVEQRRIAVVYDGVPVPAQPACGDAILVPYTADPEKAMPIAERAARLANVHIEKSVDLERDLARARALVYLTHSEGLGSGILLAMAHGVTVIASNTGGIPELITDGVNGILVSNEPKAVAAAFRRIDPALGRAARASVIERFTESQMTAATLAAYTKAIGHA